MFHLVHHSEGSKAEDVEAVVPLEYRFRRQLALPARVLNNKAKIFPALVALLKGGGANAHTHAATALVPEAAESPEAVTDMLGAMKALEPANDGIIPREVTVDQCFSLEDEDPAPAPGAPDCHAKALVVWGGLVLAPAMDRGDAILGCPAPRAA